MKMNRELKDHEITTALVAGQIASTYSRAPGTLDQGDAENAIASAIQIVQGVVAATNEAQRPIMYRYECRHGHISTASFDQGVVPDAEIDCDDENKGNNYTPCGKSAGLLGTCDEYRPEPLPPGVLHIDEFSSQAADGTDKRMGIHIEWLRGPEIGPSGNTLTPDQIDGLFGAVVSVVEEWAETHGGSSLQVLYDRD